MRWQTSGFGRSGYAGRTAVVAGLLVVAVWSGASAQTPRSPQDGVFTEAQATRGQGLYAKRCAYCHGVELQGLQGPPLLREAVSNNWHSRPLSELVTKIRVSMPADAPGKLTPQESADLVAYMLKRGGFPAAGTELPSDAASSQIIWPPNAVADAAGAAASSGRPRVFPPSGNMAQLMRGIFFPNSNLIFTVQTHDPGTKPEPTAANKAAGFSWVDWGAGIYSGWELVENAALALADSSPLMLAPGIRCENGKLAPVNDAEWIEYSEAMLAVAQKTYRVAQSRNQEAVSEATGDLADACSNCHRAYRETPRAPGAVMNKIDPSNKASRCTPRK